MSGKKTLIMTALLVLAAAFIYFYEIPNAQKKDQAKLDEKVLLDFDWDSIESLEIQSNLETISLIRNGDAWRIALPVQDQADYFMVTSILNSLQMASVDRRIIDPEKSLTEFGLQTPDMKITFKGSGIAKTLELGRKISIGGNMYVKFSDEREILLVPDSLLSAVSKSVTELRENRIFRDKIGQVSLLKIKKGDLAATFEKTKDENSLWKWRFTSPINAIADEQAIDQIVQRAKNLIATDFIHENRDADPSFGLDDPSVEITLGYETDKPSEDIDSKGDLAEAIFVEKRLKIGNATPDRMAYFAAIDGLPFVVTLSMDSVDALSAPPNSLKDRRVLRYDVESVSFIGLQIAGTSANITRLESGWSLDNGQMADNEVVGKLLDTIENLKAVQTIDGVSVKPKKFGIRKKSDFIELYDTNKVLIARLTLGKGDPKLGNVFLGRATDGKLILFELPEEDMAFWPDSVDGFNAAVENVD